jgi:outer membrane protein
LIGIAATVFALAFLLPAAALAQAKVGFVDLSKALELTEAGKRIQRDLGSKKDSLELQVKKKELEILNLRDDYNKKKNGLAPDALRQKQAAIEQAMGEYQELAQKSTMEFEQFKMKQITDFVKKMEQFATQIAQNEGYSMIILKVEDFLTGASVVLYGSPQVDLTNKVIQKLNASGTK